MQRNELEEIIIENEKKQIKKNNEDNDAYQKIITEITDAVIEVYVEKSKKDDNLGMRDSSEKD